MAEVLTGVNDVLNHLDRVSAAAKAGALCGLQKAALLVHRESIKNCPRSPTMAQIKRDRKTRKDTSKRRKASAHTRAKPGGLERSIEFEVVDRGSSATAYVFVAGNSEAGRYAKRVHDEKGKTWQNRGIGTIAKGTRADDKFIERAVAKNSGKIGAIIKREIDKAITQS